MARNHRKLRVFHDAHNLTLAIYRHTKGFPKDEWFGIRAQIRRAAVSVPTNVVEGNARRTTADYLHFLYIALGSACELQYLAGLAVALELIPAKVAVELANQCDRVVRQLERLVESMEDALACEREQTNQDRRPKTVDRRLRS